MASKKKESEGIALLSMYNDEDDDMEDRDEEDAEEDEYKVAVSRDDDSYTNDLSDPTDPVQENTPVIGSGLRFTPQHSQPPQSSPLQLAPPAEPRKNRDGKLAIVDYGHDEVALSPEAEEGEIMLNGDLQTASGDFHVKDSSETVQVMAPGVPATSQSPEQLAPSHSDLDAVDNAAVQIESMEVEETVKISVVADDDFLEKFLPPPLKRKCSEELQEKINKFLAYKRNGKSFNAEVRNRKDYRNPDFLLHAVRYQDIDQIGSCFGKDVFDPHGYDKSDYYDEIEADMKREMERKEQERKKSPKVEFVSGAAQPGNVSGSSKVTLPVPGMSNVATSGLVPVPTASDVLSRESRQNKKSKWDKVDGDRRNPMPPSGGQESVGAHAALLSAANAGAGYTAFAQQRRREAEEKRSSERRLERRS